MSQKQHVRIWFEFYKLALADPTLSETIEASREFYAPWGDVEGRSFNHWWEEHANLFASPKVRALAPTQRWAESELAFAIPRALPITTALAQIKVQLLQARTAAEVSHMRHQGFQLTPGVKFNGRSAALALRLYRDIYLPRGKPPIGKAFASDVAQYFRNRPRLKLQPIYLDKQSTEPATEDSVRSLRRAIASAKRLAEAAATGVFPSGRR